jgi:hypothetical protein
MTTDPIMLKRRVLDIAKKVRALQVGADGNIDLDQLDSLKEELILIQKSLREEINAELLSLKRSY